MNLNIDDLIPDMPLHIAAAEGDIETVKALLNAGASVNERDAFGGSTPLHEAIRQGYAGMSKLIEEALNQKPEKPEFANNSLANFPQFDMHGMARQFFQTPRPFVEAKPENLDMVRFLVESGADIHAETDTLKTTPLHAAAEGGQVETVRFLLDWGAETHRQNAQGKNALMSAAEAQRLDVVRLLLERGADPDQRTADGYTALMAAAEGGNVEIAKLLIERGVGVNVITESGNTALLIAIMKHNEAMQDYLLSEGAEVGIFEAVAMGDMERAQTLPVPELRTPHWGYTILDWAIRTENNKALRFVLSLGIQFSPNDERAQKLLNVATFVGGEEVMRLLMEAGMSLQPVSLFPTGKSASLSNFSMAISMNDVGLARLLLEQGANVEGDSNNDNALSPLLTAVTQSNLEMASMLLDMGANVNGTTGNVMAPLAMAVHKDDEAMVNLLLERGANPKDRTTIATPLSLAANSRFLPKLRAAVPNDIFEMAKAGQTKEMLAALNAEADIPAVDEHNRTALHLAARAGHTETVRALLEWGADVNLPGIANLTPLMEAVIGGDHLEIVTLLLQHGANLHAESERSDTALRYALYNKRSECIQCLMDAGAKIGMTEAGFLGDIETLRYFLREGKAVDDSNNGVTALMAAAYGGHSDCILFLLEQGANIDAVDTSGITALHYAVSSKNVDTVNLLLDQGAAIDACGEDCWTKESMRRRREEREADVNEHVEKMLAHRRGSTPLEFACFREDSAMARMLIDRGANVNGADDLADQSPLRMAVLGNRLETVRLLLECGADVGKQNYNGETVLQGSSMMNASAEIIELLQAASKTDSE